MIATTPDVNRAVFRRYAGLSLPRHVSYPMPTWWHDIDTDQVEALWAEARQPGRDRGLSLYLHIPFCEALCKFCACTRIIQRKDAPGAEERVQRYLGAIQTELDRIAEAAGSDRLVRQIHWGGGTPTYLSSASIEELHRRIERLFTVAPDAEISMEVDPRTCPPDKLRDLRRIGFNRISLGVQDFNEQVQRHVRRIQPFELVRETVSACRELGFDSVNFDLIYGMPYQTIRSVRDMAERTIELSPDRIAFYHYAQIPEKIATQRGMDYTKLPDSETKLAMFLLGLSLFEQAGYVFIGLDHFAKPTELLTTAAQAGTLQRNFQGMTTGGGLDLYGVGASAISHLLGIGFLQNVRDTDDYVRRMELDRLPIHRGKHFTEDDRIRQALMNQLYCTARVDPAFLEERFDIVFADYFSRELVVMKELEQDGLVSLDANGGVDVTRPLGRVLLRNVAAVFDAYLEPDAYRVGDRYCFSANA